MSETIEIEGEISRIIDDRHKREIVMILHKTPFNLDETNRERHEDKLHKLRTKKATIRQVI